MQLQSKIANINQQIQKQNKTNNKTERKIKLETWRGKKFELNMNLAGQA